MIVELISDEATGSPGKLFSNPYQMFLNFKWNGFVFNYLFLRFLY